MRGPKGPRRGPALEELSIISDGALLIEDGVLVEVGPSRRVENLALAAGAVEINASGKVVMPGFVDSHTHLAFPLLRSNGGDENDGARVVRANTGQRLATKARAYLEAMARHGTTTVEVKTGCGPDECAESKMLRVLSAFREEPVQVIPSFLFRIPPQYQNGEFRQAADWVMGDLLPKIWKRGIAEFADVAWDALPERHESFGRYLQVARDLGFSCKIHADQMEPAAAVATAVRHLVVSIDHLEHATGREAAMLSASGVMATLTPCASFREGRHAPARALVEAGVPIAIATNFNPHHTPTLNMQMAIALACLHMRLSVAEAISAATINGAHALGCADRVGSLEPGKSADVLILNVPDYRDLAHTIGTNVVHLTIKRGDVIYREGSVRPRKVG